MVTGETSSPSPETQQGAAPPESVAADSATGQASGSESQSEVASTTDSVEALATEEDCTDPSYECLPTGDVNRELINETEMCTWPITFYWGDDTSNYYLSEPLSTQPVTHHYAKPHFYTITVIAQPGSSNDPDWICEGAVIEIPVEVPQDLKPTASFTAEPTTTDRQVTLDASGSAPSPGRNITQYEWDFGDGTFDATPSPTITHEFPEGGRDYTVKLVVVDNENSRSRPYILDVHSPSSSSKVEIGKVKKFPEDFSERPIAMYSTLEVKSVQNLGCGVEPTPDAPACNFEWLRSRGQQDSDYEKIDDGTSPLSQYDLFTADFAHDIWHLFKVRATNPDTGQAVESAPLEVDHVIPQLPYIMRQRGWTAAALLDWWLMQGAVTKPAGVSVPEPKDLASSPPEELITMDGFVLKYPRYKEVYDEIINNPNSWRTAGFERELRKELTEHGLLTNTSGGSSFDLIAGRSGYDRYKDSVQTVPYSFATQKRKVTGEYLNPDDGSVSLGNFGFQINVAGTVEPCKKDCGTAGAYNVTINQLGVSVRDSFDFNDDEDSLWPFSQYLACWSPYYNTASGTSLRKDACLFNSDFRDWRDHWGDKGGDYMIYSDVKSTNLRHTYRSQARKA